MTRDFRDLLDEAESRLREARNMIGAEIADYPTPIAGCDAQFNHLLSERQKIDAALEAMGRDVFVPTPRSPMPHSGIESR